MTCISSSSKVTINGNVQFACEDCPKARRSVDPPTNLMRARVHLKRLLSVAGNPICEFGVGGVVVFFFKTTRMKEKTRRQKEKEQEKERESEAVRVYDIFSSCQLW
jgi:hypothetical protein